NAAPGARTCLDKRGGRVVVNNQAIVHQLMSAHSMCPIEQVYGTVFENVLGEKISTKPVDVDRPFSWNDKQGNRLTKYIRQNRSPTARGFGRGPRRFFRPVPGRRVS